MKSNFIVDFTLSLRLKSHLSTAVWSAAKRGINYKTEFLDFSHVEKLQYEVLY